MKLSELGRTTFFFATREEAHASADTIKKMTDRDACVKEIRTFDHDGVEMNFSVEIEPNLEAPSVAQIEDALQSAWEDWVAQYVQYAEDCDMDLREMTCEAWPNKAGFHFKLPLAGVGFKITIEHFYL